MLPFKKVRDAWGICSGCMYKNQAAKKCKAFPYGIPGKIITGEISHMEGIDGDGGINYLARHKTRGK